MHTTTYTPPVDKLLTYSVLKDEPFGEWSDYLAPGLSQENVPDLIYMAKDKELRNIDSDDPTVEDDPKFWAPVHALRALGQLRAEAAIEPLLPLFEDLDDEWIVEDMVEVYGMIGAAAIPTLTAYISDPSHNEFARSYATEALEEIAKRHPESRGECITALTQQLESFAENDPSVNSDLISALTSLKATEALPLIEGAFAADSVEEGMVGDWDDVQVAFGLKERTSPFRSLFETPTLSSAQEKTSFSGNPYVKTSNKSGTTKKAKGKMAKASRKKNRRKK